MGNGDNICKNLGFPGGRISEPGRYPEVSKDTPIHWIRLQCKGTETSPLGCQHTPAKTDTDCRDDYHDLVLSCDNTVRLGCRTETGGQVNGRVEVYAGDQWGVVCDDGFNQRQADIVCTSLAYSGAVATYSTISNSCSSPRPILLANLACNGDEASLLDCSRQNRGIPECNENEVVEVSCGLFRLLTAGCKTAQSPGLVTGRLEVAMDGKWGTIFNQTVGNGDNICKSLGFSGGKISEPGQCPEAGKDRPIHWTNLQCDGTETSLWDCQYTPAETVTGCRHDHDVVLSCNTTRPRRKTETADQVGGSAQPGAGVHNYNHYKDVAVSSRPVIQSGNGKVIGAAVGTAGLIVIAGAGFCLCLTARKLRHEGNDLPDCQSVYPQGPENHSCQALRFQTG